SSPGFTPASQSPAFASFLLMRKLHSRVDGENPQSLFLRGDSRTVFFRPRRLHLRAADRAHLEARRTGRQSRGSIARHPRNVRADLAGVPRSDGADGAAAADPPRIRPTRVG